MKNRNLKIVRRKSKEANRFIPLSVELLESRQLLTTVTEFAAPAGANPQNIVSGPDGNLWFTEFSANKIGKITTAGVVTEYALAAGSNPDGITAGPDGNLWFTENGTNKVAKITTSGSVTEFTLTSANSHPHVITAGPDGNLWLTETTTSFAVRVTTAGVITQYNVFSNGPQGITTGPDGNLYATGAIGNTVVKFATTGANGGVYNIPTFGSGAHGIATGSDGNLWFTETSTNKITKMTTAGVFTEYVVPTASSQPTGITSGPGGSLYFTEAAGNKIGQITTAGVFTETTITSASATPAGITLGPDGNIWFTEAGTSKIGRLSFGPTATNDSYNAVSGVAFTTTALTGVLANDTGSGTLTAGSPSNPGHGTLTLNSDGSFTYTATAGYFGPDSFTYQVSDGTNTATATVAFVVRAETAPVTVNDSYTAEENTNLVKAALAGVLANDSDADSDPITASIVSQPGHGSVTLNLDGSFTYAPAINYHGPDSFTYKTNDGYFDGNTGTVSIQVNAPPQASDDSYTAPTNGSLNVSAALGVLSNDTDGDSDPLTAMLVNNVGHGMLTLSPNGAFVYTPTAGYSGPDSFTYKPNDGNVNGNTATVNILVNTAPVATDDSYTINEDGTLSIALPGVLGNDNDVDLDTLFANFVTNPDHGMLSLNPDGSFSYSPDANYNGTDSFTYQVSDGHTVSNIATVNLTITPVNDAPVAGDDAYSTNEDTPLAISLPGVLSNDTDVDLDSLQAGLVAGPSHGFLSFSADGSFIYTPDANYHGTDSFTYKATDGQALSNVATVNLTVDSVNDAPVAFDDAFTTPEDTPLTIPAPGVMGNDVDADADTLSAALITGPAHGAITFNADGSFTYTAGTNFNGTDSFTYQVTDGAANSNTATVFLTVTSVNDAPVAANDSFTTAEDTPLNGLPGVLANDTDVELNALTATLVTGPSHGAFVLFPNGTFKYTPDLNYNGTDSFTYQAYDGTDYSNVATVNLSITAVNDAPVATDDSFTTDEDTPLTIVLPGILTNDTDVEGDSLTASLVVGPSHGTLTLNEDGSFTYTPESDFNGTDSFTYQAFDGDALSNTATVNLTINAVNDAPVAFDDSYATDEDTPLTVALPGVLANDTDVDGDSLTAALVSGPSHGTFTFNTDGSFTYTPEANYNGTDSFTYQTFDGAVLSNIATVNLTINAVNDAPVAVGESFITDEDTPLTISLPGVLANDTDVEGDSLTASLVVGPSHGTLTFNPDGSFTYTPEPNYNGTDSFTYQASDGSAVSNIATISLIINAVDDAPVAADDSFTTDEDTPLTVNLPGVLANDTDVEGDSLTASLVAGPSHGTFSLNSDGSFTYTPEANYNGTDSFTYQTFDGAVLSNIATVNLTINAVNDAPVAVGESFVTDEDTPLTISLPGVLANDTDVEGDSLTASLVVGPSHGTLTFNPDGSFTYTPEPNYNGTDSFTYQASDGNALSNIATVSLTINPVNDAPVAVNDSFATDEDTPLTITLPGVLANDSDIDGDNLSAALVAGPSHGTFTLNIDGSFTYTPEANYNGSDSFTYQTFDGTVLSNIATVSLTVTAVNDAPVAVSDAFATGEDTPLTIVLPGVLANDNDVDGDTLSAALVAGPNHGTLALNPDGSFTYTPAANYNGSDSFTYQASDGTTLGNIATVNLTVNAVNDAPVGVDDSFTTDEDTSLTVALPGILANDSDVDGDSLTAELVAGPSHGALTLNSDGSFIYTPIANYNGSDSFTYQTFDGTVLSNISTVNLTVTAVNDAPVAVDESFTTDEDTPLSVNLPGLLASDTDVDGDTLSAVLVTGPSHGVLTFNAAGSFTYTPDANYNGNDSFTYLANDGTANSNTATVQLTITAVNDAPVAVGESFTTVEDTPLTVALPGLLGNDTDIEGDALSAVLVVGPSHGTLSLNADGSFSYTPAANYNGTDSFTYQANDGFSDSNTATVNLTITAVNDAPVAVGESFTTAEDTPLTAVLPGVLTNDTDADGDVLSAVLVTGPSHGTLTLNLDGSFTYAPAANYNGSDSFTYLANDGTANSNTATVTLTVTAVNDAPVAVGDAFTTAENAGLTSNLPGVLANDSDVDGDALHASLVSGPTHGTLTLNTDGSFVYTPAVNYHGDDSFTYQATDGTAVSNVVTVALTVTPVNQAPVVTALSQSVEQGTALSNVVVATFTDSDADPLAGPYLATINWGDGTPATVGVVTLVDGTFQVTGSHVYDTVGSFSLQVAVTDPAGGAAVTSTATSTVTAIPAEFMLQGVIDTGTAGSTPGSKITNISTPHVSGVAPPGDAVTLYATLAGGAQATVVGHAVAGQDGTFTITSDTLADGVYTFSLTAVNPQAPGSTLVLNASIGTVTVDTEPPTVSALTLDPKTGRFLVTFKDIGAGMDLTTVLNTANYAVSKSLTATLRGRQFVVTGISIASSDSGLLTVEVVINNGHRIAARQLFIVASGTAIKDAAGNQLNGAFTGTFPTGTGDAGSNFQAEIDIKHRTATAAKPVTATVVPASRRVQRTALRAARHNHD